MSGVGGAAHRGCVHTRPHGGPGKAVAFRAAGEDLGRALLESRGAALHVAGRMKLDSWQGRDEVQIQIEDAAFAAG
jgi:single-stranded-DNA-specific exonuclease